MDRVTELQLLLDKFGEDMYTSIGLIQSRANPNNFGYSASLPPPTEEIITEKWLREMATTIVAHSKEIQTKIEELPGIQTTEEEQLLKLEKLEQINQDLEQQILSRLQEAEKLKTLVNNGLQEIARDRTSALQ